MSRLFASAAALAALAFTGSAEAHTFGTHGAGLAQGFAHPFSGLDHLLAMVTVGVWAAQRGGKALWLMPLAFMSMMALGGVFGLTGIALPGVELAIAASVMALGSLVALAVKPSLPVGMALVGVFAIFHGQAHGAEMPVAAQPALYALGFLAATFLLHAVGVASCVVVKRDLGAKLVRLSGGVVAASGLAMAVL